MLKVIPRDLFNDGNLLNNYGNLYLSLENLGLEDLLVNDGEDFSIGTDNLSGCTYITNIRLYSHTGEEIFIYRPQNSKEQYSLWYNGEDEDYEVFTSKGTITSDLKEVLGYSSD